MSKDKTKWEIGKWATLWLVWQCVPVLGYAGGGDPISGDGELLRWSEAGTWEREGFRVASCEDEGCLCPAMVPVAGKTVRIPAGARVLLDVDTPVLNGLMVHGELIFEDKAGVGYRRIG